MTTRGHRQHRSICRSRLLVAVCFTCLSAGCGSLKLATPRLTFDDAAAEPPAKMIPVWSDTVMSRPGQLGVRGLGGRVVFYGRETDEPVQVNGSLIVYGWDDTQGNLNQTPDRKYVVTPEELAGHLSQSTIGDSYSIWIPWDHAGSQHKRVTIVAKYVGQDGVELASTPQRVVLPGPLPELLSQAQQEQAKPITTRTPSKVQHAGCFTEPHGVATERGQTVNTTSQSGRTAARQAQWSEADSLPGTDLESLYSSAPTREFRQRQSSVQRMQTSTIPVTSGFAQRHFRAGDVVDLESLDLQSTPVPVQPRPTGVPVQPEPREAAGRPAVRSLNQHSSIRSRPQSYGTQQTRRAANDLAGPTIGEWQEISGRESEAAVRQSRQGLIRPESGYSRSQFQARTQPAVRPAGGHVRKQPHRSTWQRGLPPTPRSTPATDAGVYDLR